MSYITFKTFTSEFPLTSATTLTFNLFRGATALSAASGYNVDIDSGTGTGVYRVSAICGSTLLSSFQVSGADKTYSIAAATLSADDEFQVIVAHLSGGKFDNFTVNVNVLSPLAGAELEFRSFDGVFGSSAGTATSDYTLTFDKVGYEVYRGSYTVTATALSSFTVAVSGGLSGNEVIDDPIFASLYFFQGDPLSFKIAPLSASLIASEHLTFSTTLDTVPFSGGTSGRTINDHLRLRRQGQI